LTEEWIDRHYYGLGMFSMLSAKIVNNNQFGGYLPLYFAEVVKIVAK
jgi:hypothetical protein